MDFFSPDFQCGLYDVVSLRSSKLHGKYIYFLRPAETGILFQFIPIPKCNYCPQDLYSNDCLSKRQILPSGLEAKISLWPESKKCIQAAGVHFLHFC
jgi:hypothetical protein